MIVKEISFPIPLTNVENIYDGTVDVYVELEDNSLYTYSVVVATLKNIKSSMDTNRSNFFGPGLPIIIVTKLTMEIIQEAIQAYAESNDAYWLKLYSFAAFIHPNEFERVKKDEHENELNNI